MLTDLADALRAGGVAVQVTPNWTTRGHGEMRSVESIIAHHTAGPPTGNSPSLGVVINGRTDLKGPLAQLFLARNGVWFVVAAGVCWHAGLTFETWQNNYHAIGIEAEGTGKAPWPTTQYSSYVQGVAALRKHYGVPLARVLGHKEIAKPLGRKTDPNFNMAAFRTAVGAVSGTGQDIEEDEFMGMTPEQIGAAVAAALAPKFEAIEQKYVVADNKYDAQMSAWTSVAQALAAHRIAEQAEKGPITADGLKAIYTEVWNFLRPLWTTK